jgi:hypothetical protein
LSYTYKDIPVSSEEKRKNILDAALPGWVLSGGAGSFPESVVNSPIFGKKVPGERLQTLCWVELDKNWK